MRFELRSGSEFVLGAAVDGTRSLTEIIKRSAKIIYKQGNASLNGDSKSAIRREISLERKWKGLRGCGKDESVEPNLLAMIARTIGISGRCRRVYLPPFSPFNRARERASGIIYKPVLFPKPCICRRKRQ